MDQSSSSPVPSSPSSAPVDSDESEKDALAVPLLSRELSEGSRDGFLLKVSTEAFLMAGPTWLTFTTNAALNLLCIALVGEYSSDVDLAAMGLSNVFCNITGFSILWGLVAAVNTLSSQALGAEAYTMIGIYLQRSIVLVFVLGVLPIAITWVFAKPILLALGQEEAVVVGVQTFSIYRIPGLAATGIFVPLSSTLTAMGKTTLPGGASVFGVVIGCGISYLLIVHLNMGLQGAAITQTTREFLQVGYLLVASYMSADFRRCWTAWSRRALEGWIPFLKLSMPAMVMQNVEWWSWEIVTFESGLLSADLLAMQTVLANVTNLTYFVPLALSFSVTMLVGKFLGARDVSAARRTAGVLVVATMCILLASILGIVFARRSIAEWFSSDAGVSAGVVDMAPLCVSFSFLDGFQCAMTGVVKGTGQQRIFAPIILVCYWLVGIPLGYVLAFHLDYKLVGLWYGMVAAVGLHCLCYAIAIMGCISFERAADEAAARLREENAEDQDLVPVTGEILTKSSEVA